MVRKGSATILPRVTQRLTGDPREGSISQEKRKLQGAILLNPIRIESLEGSPFTWLFSTFIISFIFYMVAFLTVYLKNKVFMQVDNLIYCFFILLGLSFFSGLIYKNILNRTVDQSIFVYASIYVYSFIYLPIPIVLEVLGWTNVAYILYFAVAMVSQFWISTVLLENYFFSDNKNQFLFHLATFILQFGGVILVGRSLTFSQ